MLQEYIKQFLQSKRLKAKNTQEFYEKGLRFYSEAYPDWPITDVNITNFLADTSERGCTVSTVHCYFRAIKTFCNWLYKRKIIIINPVELVDAPKLPHLLPRAPKLQAIIDLFLSIVGDDWYDLRDKALLALALDTGMRISEIAYLKVMELDLEARSVLIRQAKSGRQRVVMFDVTTQHYLQLWLAKKAVLRIEFPAVFLGGRNHGMIAPLTRSGVYQILQRRLKAAGLEHFRFHDLRHGYAIYSLQNGANLMDVSKQLGHSNIAVTNVYTQVIDEGRGGRHDNYSPVANLTKK